MSSARSSYKEEAQEALARGDLKKALDGYQKHCLLEPEDLRSSAKVGELLEKLGRRREAIQAYQSAAEAYAKDGFLLQAISLNKMILRLDPSAREISDRIVQLYHEKNPEEKAARTCPPIPLFSDLKEEELESLLQKARVKTFPRDGLICREGETGDSLFVILRGETEVWKKNLKDREVRIRNLREGDFLGEFGFFTDQKRHATVRALVECEVLEVSKEELGEMIRVHPRMKEVLEKFFRQRVLDTFFVLSPLFSPLAPKEREEVFKRFRPKRVPAGRFVFRQGDPPDSLYLVKSGEVELYAEGRAGQKVRVALVRSGNFFGEVGILFRRGRMAHAKTTQPTELLELTQEDLDKFFHQFPALRAALKEISTERMARIGELLSKNTVERSKEAIV